MPLGIGYSAESGVSERFIANPLNQRVYWLAGIGIENHWQAARCQVQSRALIDSDALL
jgi:hypothetical protein